MKSTVKGGEYVCVLMLGAGVGGSRNLNPT